MPAVLTRASLAALVLLAACKQDDAAKPAPAPAPVTPTPVARAIDAPAPGPRCDAPVRHADEVLRATGTPLLVSMLLPVEQSIAACESQRWSDEILACAATTTDARGLFYGCYAKALGDDPLVIRRRFHALEDNRAASPAAGTADGDYVAIDDRCGTFTRARPPALAFYYMCGDDAQGPLMLPDDIRELYAALAADESSRHGIVTSLIAGTRIDTHRVNTYDTSGNYVGTHTDF